MSLEILLRNLHGSDCCWGERSLGHESLVLQSSSKWMVSDGEKRNYGFSVFNVLILSLVRVWRNCFWLFHLFLSGWGSHHAAHSLDASREYHVQEVHHRKRCLEPGGCIMGNLYLWQTAMVSAFKQRGVCNAFSNCVGKAGTLTVGVASLEKGQQQIYLVEENPLISGIYDIVMNFVVEFFPFYPFLLRVCGNCPSATIPVWI